MNKSQEYVKANRALKQYQKDTRLLVWVWSVFIALAVTVIFAAPAHAESKADKYAKLCPAIESSARAVMKARQKGLPLKKLMVMDSTIIRELAKLAYKKPRWSTDRSISRAIEGFANDQYLSCLSLAERDKD